jgi:hypothetical protein
MCARACRTAHRGSVRFFYAHESDRTKNSMCVRHRVLMVMGVWLVTISDIIPSPKMAIINPPMKACSIILQVAYPQVALPKNRYPSR